MQLQNLNWVPFQILNCLREYFIILLISGIEDGSIRKNEDGDYIVALRYLPSIELVVTILAFLKCGIAYVPIAPNWPSGRIRLVLEDAKPAMVFTNTKVELVYKAISELEDECSIPSVYQVQGFKTKSSSFQILKLRS